jgi:hypothetical protein
MQAFHGRLGLKIFRKPRAKALSSSLLILRALRANTSKTVGRWDPSKTVLSSVRVYPPCAVAFDLGHPSNPSTRRNDSET